MAREYYTVPQWFKEVGKPRYDLTSINYVYSCCRMEIDPRNNRPRRLPEGWKSKKDDILNRVFIYEDAKPTKKTAQTLKRAETPAVQKSYESAKLDPALETELKTQLRQAILHGVPKRIVIEFLPEPAPFITFGKGISSDKVRQWFSKRVGRIFNEHGHEILLGSKLRSNVYDYRPPTDIEFVLRAWWRLNVQQSSETSASNKKSTSKQKEFRELRELLKGHFAHNPDREIEVMDQLWKRCIWCGVEKRKIDPNIRVDAKYCSDEHKGKFQFWLKQLKEPLVSARKREDEFMAQLEKIRLALAT